MDWKDLQEAMTAFGAAAGVIALAWNGLVEWRSRRARNAARITASLKMQPYGELLTVHFQGAETHTRYTVTVRCKVPRALHIQRVTLDSELDPVVVGPSEIQPTTLVMQPSHQDQSAVFASFVPHGFSQQKELRLTFIVREGFGRRVIARRTLPMTVT